LPVPTGRCSVPGNDAGCAQKPGAGGGKFCELVVVDDDFHEIVRCRRDHAAGRATGRLPGWPWGGVRPAAARSRLRGSAAGVAGLVRRAQVSARSGTRAGRSQLRGSRPEPSRNASHIQFGAAGCRCAAIALRIAPEGSRPPSPLVRGTLRSQRSDPPGTEGPQCRSCAGLPCIGEGVSTLTGSIRRAGQPCPTVAVRSL